MKLRAVNGARKAFLARAGEVTYPKIDAVVADRRKDGVAVDRYRDRLHCVRRRPLLNGERKTVRFGEMSVRLWVQSE
jgi:hypothetical protein